MGWLNNKHKPISVPLTLYPTHRQCNCATVHPGQKVPFTVKKNTISIQTKYSKKI